MPDNSPPAPGWYHDPAGPGQRWWNGVAWSDATRPAAPAGVPPVRPVAPLLPPGTGPAAPAPPAPLPPYAAGAAYAYPGPWAARPPVPPRVTGMGTAVRAVFGSYADFSGRATRPEYWFWYLFSVIVTIGAYLLIWIPFVGILIAFALIAWAVAVFVPSLAVTVRRLRDAGFHWGFLFLQLVPFGGIVVLVLLCQASKDPGVAAPHPAYRPAVPPMR